MDKIKFLKDIMEELNTYLYKYKAEKMNLMDDTIKASVYRAIREYNGEDKDILYYKNKMSENSHFREGFDYCEVGVICYLQKMIEYIRKEEKKD